MNKKLIAGILSGLIVSSCLAADTAPAVMDRPAPVAAPVAAPVVPQRAPGVTPQPENTSQSEWAAWMIEGGRAAQDYVQLLDQGRYADSWTKGAKIFQNTITQTEWKTALNLARSRLGRVTARTLKDQKPAWNPAGLPPGPYMVVEYNTSFEKAPGSGELLTLMRENDGKWKVLTYQVN